MLTVLDKAIAALLPGIFLWLNQKYGFSFDISNALVNGRKFR